MKHKTKNRKNRYQRSDIPYADRLLINEYYSDIEVGEVHLNERLASMGFIIMEGKLMVPVQKAEGQPEEAVISGERFEEAE